MTENNERIPRPEEIIEEHKELPPEGRMRPLRCRAGSAMPDGGCQREATTWMYPENKDYPLCDEHARVEELAKEANDLALAEDVTHDWLRVAKGWGIEVLEDLAEIAHEKAKEQYVKAHARLGLAVERADAPRSGEPFLTREQDEKLRELIRRGDSLNDAYAVAEDAPEERLRGEARRRLLGVLATERDKAWEETNRYKAELGLEVAEPERVEG